jgi:hypothetical protein
MERRPQPGQRRRLPPRPLVFMFQPTHYEVVPPERLAEWEKTLAERVGLPVDASQLPSSATPTITFCPNVQDDSDQDPD